MSLPKPNLVEPPWNGPVCPVVGEGWRREVCPYPDQWMTIFHVRRDKAARFQRVQAPPGDPLQPEARASAGTVEDRRWRP